MNIALFMALTHATALFMNSNDLVQKHMDHWVCDKGKVVVLLEDADRQRASEIDSALEVMWEIDPASKAKSTAVFCEAAGER